MGAMAGALAGMAAVLLTTTAATPGWVGGALVLGGAAFGGVGQLAYESGRRRARD